MKKHIIFGGFDYAVRWEMDQDAIYQGIDYFVDNNPELIGTTYLGKPIYSPEKLLEEDKEGILILIGSIIYHTELEFQLKRMGFEEDVHYKWAIGFCGDECCPRLWRHIEWNDRKANSSSIEAIENGEQTLTMLKLISDLMDFNKISAVVDIGAANGRIKEFLPERVHYTPVDYIAYSDETVLCDLTKKEFPSVHSDPAHTCIVLSGIIIYAPDWRWLLQKAAESGDTVICVHNDFARMNREFRRTHFSHHNAIFNHQIILEMQKLGFMLTEAYDYRLRCVVMKFEKTAEM